MAKFRGGFFGMAAVRVCGAEPALFLTRCAGRGIEPVSVEAEDEYTLCLHIPARQLGVLEHTAEISQCTVLSVRREGAARFVRRLRRRAFPAALLLFLLALAFWSRAYIWEIEVFGNEAVPTGKILNALSECGVETGSCWLGFTSDSIRSQVLEHLPELSWITVNIYGSRAEVIVRERIKKPEMISDEYPCDIVASREGFVVEVRALMGQAEISPGSAVIKGERLISGTRQSLAGGEKRLRALGEVWAETYYEISAAAPEKQEKAYTGEEKSRWALVIGKKRLNFYRNSSIYDADCDKIYNEYKLEAGGLFSLPIKLVRETAVYYNTVPAKTDERLLQLRLEQNLSECLPATPEGEVISQSFTAAAAEGGMLACLRARCRENIAITAPLPARDDTASKEGNFQ